MRTKSLKIDRRVYEQAKRLAETIPGATPATVLGFGLDLLNETLAAVAECGGGPTTTPVTPRSLLTRAVSLILDRLHGRRSMPAIVDRFDA